MTLPGGPADKLRNRYEEWWTVSELVRMLRGDAESIRIGAPGVQKAEFVVTLPSYRELHQAKRDHPSGKWSLAAFDLVELLLHEARGARARAPVHTVVVCRAFGWKNDARLRKLMPDEHAQVDVAEFTVEDVKGLLAAAEVDCGFARVR